MTEQDILKFIEWLKSKDMYIAGDTFNGLLGVYRPAPLAIEDYPNVIADFLKDQVKS